MLFILSGELKIWTYCLLAPLNQLKKKKNFRLKSLVGTVSSLESVLLPSKSHFEAWSGKFNYISSIIIGRVKTLFLIYFFYYFLFPHFLVPYYLVQIYSNVSSVSSMLTYTDKGEIIYQFIPLGLRAKDNFSIGSFAGSES
jgi:hypothetical protein